ncbi:taperin isoform X2 [Ahaetulla prasina]|uniref:taperin isoform X2 n=1 Tax=Ahaetulla prasina TaxID=499056 RepID=UPI00264973C8|nr:taperin isoform X2 [Ahaetulla prasina]
MGCRLRLYAKIQRHPPPKNSDRLIGAVFRAQRRDSSTTANRRGRSAGASPPRPVGGAIAGGPRKSLEAATAARPVGQVGGWLLALSGVGGGAAAAAAAEAPAWKLALLERKRAKLAAGMGLEPGWGSAPRPGQGSDGREAGTVVAESLGPLRGNPFMRLESERRRRRGGGSCEFPGPASTPSPPAESPALAQLLQLYGAMPGIRTIRAGNILIIESSDPAQPAQGSAPGRQSPLRDLLARRGPPVAEIRAAQVVVYEPGPPPLSTGPDAGLVSRLLQKFDRPGQGKGRGGDGPVLKVPPPPSPPSTRPPGAQGGGGGVFLQKIGSNSFVVNPRGHRPDIAAASALNNGRATVEEGTPPPPSSPGQCGMAAISKAVPSSRSPAPSSLPPAEAGKPKSKAVAALETSPQPPPPSSAMPAGRASDSPPWPSPLFSSSCSFEIRPALKPNLATIPAHDLQARALASLRLNSRNSFLFVPHRKEAPPDLPQPAEALPAAPEEKSVKPLVPVTYIDEDLVAAMPPLKVLSPRLEGFQVPREGALALETEDPALPTCRPLSAGSVTRTFTVVPKRKPPTAGLEPFSRAWLQEEEKEDKSQREAQMGAPLQESGRVKKRYPTVSEIEVIGGYLSLNKSCMSKSGIRRKKMKISFNETSLQTMFEYPSESSLVEEEEEGEYATEVHGKPAFLTPHPNSSVNSNPVNSGLEWMLSTCS